MSYAVCLFARDEERDLAEWIAYQLAIGFHACLIYDNESRDRTPEIVTSFGTCGHDVRLIPWDNTGKAAQGACYADCITRFGREFDWIAFVDADEFIVPEVDIPTLLLARDAHDAIALNWLMFGSSGLVERPPGSLVETFTRRARDDLPANRTVKSIVRPSAVVRNISPHTFALREGRRYATVSGADVVWLSVNGSTQAPDLRGGWINHYFTKSREDWNRKLARGYRDTTKRDPDGAFAAYDHNEVSDSSAVRFMPAVRGILDKLSLAI